MLERQWQRKVENIAKAARWRYYHTHDSRRSASGFPDLVLVRPPRLIFAELKLDDTYTTPEQQAWLRDLQGVVDAAYAWNAGPGAGVPEVYVWRPLQIDDVKSILGLRGL